ncbi:hypothetical protein D3C76_1254120 [compost metagenome]
MVGQSHTGSIRRLHQHSGIETKGRIVAIAFEFSIIATRAQWVGHCAGYLATDTVDRRAEPDRNPVIEGIADGGLKRERRDLAFVAIVASGKVAAVIGNQAERHIETHAERPMFIDGLDVVTHGHGGRGHDVAVFLAAKGTAGLADVILREERRRPQADLL